MYKYTEITNSYQDKFISFFLDKYPELENETFVIQEKIDGSNIRIHYDNIKKEFSMGSRNQIIPMYGSIGQSTKEVLEEPRMQELLEHLKYFCEFRESDSVTLYGEFFGPKICKRIYYGDKRRILFFDLMINDNYVSPYELYSIFSPFKDLFIQKKSIIKGLKNALEFETRISSDFSPTHQMIEGVVIKPFYKVYTDNDGDMFYLKKKNTEFLESPAKKKREKEQHDIKDNRFIEYVNENRIKSVISKESEEFTSPKQFGNYIKLVQTDALIDFKKDFHDIELEDWEIKSSSKKIVDILKTYL